VTGPSQKKREEVVVVNSAVKSGMKPVLVPVPRGLLVLLALAFVAIIVRETPPVIRELKIMRM
jgi:hypothetical protein